MSPNVREPLHLAPSIRKNAQLFNSDEWLKQKNEFDQIDQNLWRIGGKLYNLDSFAKNHPGGAEWIQMTKGTDITEAFEVAHVFGNENKEQILNKYFVKDASRPRSSWYTFHPDDFYMTLKRRAQKILREVGTGPTKEILMLQDILALVFHVLMFSALLSSSATLIVASGIVLGMAFTVAHNFFHMADNFRMYYWDLSLFSSYDWRVTHMISHHLHTNTYNDFESFAFFPLLDLYVNQEKNSFHRFLGPVYSHFLIGVAGLHQYVTRMLCILIGKTKLRPENLIPLVQLAFFIWLSDWSLLQCIGFWILMHFTASSWLGFTTLLSTHHHPSSYHAGDFRVPQTDWGINQLDSNRDVKSDNLFLIVTTLKNHTLHHMFPTVDHSKLHHLYPAFEETCREFKIDFQFESAWEMAKGFYRQIMRITPQTLEQRLALKTKKNKLN